MLRVRVIERILRIEEFKSENINRENGQAYLDIITDTYRMFMSILL